MGVEFFVVGRGGLRFSGRMDRLSPKKSPKTSDLGTFVTSGAHYRVNISICGYTEISVLAREPSCPPLVHEKI